jgi:superfamily II RNA helicase
MAPDDVAIIIAKMAKVEQELVDYKESHEALAQFRYKSNVEKLETMGKKIDDFTTNCLGVQNKNRIDKLSVWAVISAFFILLLFAMHGVHFDLLNFLPK